jgi:hypothetical protein
MVVAGVIGLVLELMEPLNAIGLIAIACVCLTLSNKDWYPPIAVFLLALCSWYLACIAKILLVVVSRDATTINDTIKSTADKLYSIDSSENRIKIDQFGAASRAKIAPRGPLSPPASATASA